MGTRGPVPMLSGEKVGHPKQAGGHEANVTKGRRGKKTEWLDAPAHWHDTAVLWYESLSASGQSTFYEASDRTFAFFLAGEMSDYLTGEGRSKSSALMFSALISAMSLLLNTEADRRRSGIELNNGPVRTENKGAAAMAGYMEGLRKPANPAASAA